MGMMVSIDLKNISDPSRIEGMDLNVPMIEIFGDNGRPEAGAAQACRAMAMC
jgi:hypothetical protein